MPQMYLAVLKVMFYIREMERSLEKPLEKWDSGHNFPSKLSFSLWSGHFPSLSLCFLSVEGVSAEGFPSVWFHEVRTLNIWASCWGVVCVCALSYVRLCDLMDCSPSGSSVHEISQARILEWVSHFPLQGIFLIQELNLCLLGLLAMAGRFFTAGATWEACWEVIWILLRTVPVLDKKKLLRL